MAGLQPRYDDSQEVEPFRLSRLAGRRPALRTVAPPFRLRSKYHTNASADPPKRIEREPGEGGPGGHPVRGRQLDSQSLEFALSGAGVEPRPSPNRVEGRPSPPARPAVRSRRSAIGAQAEARPLWRGEGPPKHDQLGPGGSGHGRPGLFSSSFLRFRDAGNGQPPPGSGEESRVINVISLDTV
jgi:hypothetical protein